MTPVKLSSDQRPHHGHTSVFINPDDVSSVYANSDSTDNPTIVAMKNGQKFAVEGWPDEVVAKLYPASPAPEQPVKPSVRTEEREINRTLPTTLDTAQFREAWGHWILYWGQAKNNGRPIPIATADSHLTICVGLGAILAVQAIDNAISKGLREPCLPAGSKSTGEHGTGKRAAFA